MVGCINVPDSLLNSVFNALALGLKYAFLVQKFDFFSELLITMANAEAIYAANSGCPLIF